MTDFVRASYDAVADRYDHLWCRHVAEPDARLDRDLRVRRGDRLAELACGDGSSALRMSRRASLSAAVGVDVSAGMLERACARFGSAGHRFDPVLSTIESFVEDPANQEAFDVVSLRYALAYLDWRSVVPRLAALLRRGGRLGILSCTSASVPQVWEVYRDLVRDLGMPVFPATVPDRIEDVAMLLVPAGLEPDRVWQWDLRIWFSSGARAAEWLRLSGCVSHPSLANADPAALQSLESLVAAGLESFRETRGVPLDLSIGGLVARRSRH